MAGLTQDIRIALRQLRKNPGFSAIAVLTLALGIGASTAMFGVLNAVLLQPLPFPGADRIVRIFSISHIAHGGMGGPSPLDLRDFAAQDHTFENMAIYDVWRKNVSTSDSSIEAEQLQIGLVPGEYFEVLGIKPMMGRLFRDDENRWGNNFVAIVSHSFWQTHFHGDPSILNKSVRINDEPYSIVAVLPQDIPSWAVRDPQEKVDIWTPFVPYSTAGSTVWDEASRGERGWGAIGRLKAGVTLEQANADLQRIADNLAAQYPVDRGVGVKLQSIQEDRVRNLRPILRVLMGAVLMMLLIACANVANLLLARNAGRRREVALRVAIGANSRTLIRQFITESLTLGLVGGLLGCGVAWWGCEFVARIHPAQLPQLATVAIDYRVLAFSFIIAVISSLIFGTAPALASLNVNPAEAFKEGARTNTGSRGRKRLGRLLVISEMAFAVMLLIGTGLLIQSLLRLQKQDAGFREDHLLTTDLYLPPVRYPDKASLTRFSEEYAARVRHLPGVQDATISGGHPPQDHWMQLLSIERRPASGLEDMPSIARNVSDFHYLHTLGIPLLKGRDFSESDNETSVPVALVNQAFVNQFFPNEDPIGKQIRMTLPSDLAAGTPGTRFTIVGVTGNTMNRGPALPPLPHVITLFRQSPDLNVGFKNLLVRTSLDPLQLAGSIRQQLHSLDPNLPFAEVATMDQLIEQQTADRRYTTGLLALFACFGVVLALIGVYGVVSYVVAQSTSEIGVRMALGARRADVLQSILKQGMGMAVIGASIGILGGWVLRQAVAQLVFGISPTDPLTFSSAAVLLIAFALLASLVPARRAMLVDPMVALRYE
ncbi:MAG TPA: ABC transporter permease [Candidatus Sulfotelmatobacter sp.]|nr:ABC transporter permease [Candidatus Sulfotelmatobacter sp.]